MTRFVLAGKEYRGRAGADAAPRSVCVYLEVEDDGRSDGNGGEAVLAGGRRIGTVSSIAYGHRTGRLLAFAYVAPEHAAPGTPLDVLIMGESRPARILAEPAYDPEGRLPRADVPALAAE